MFTTAIILPAGKSIRLGGHTPKQFLKIDGKQVLSYSINTFKNHPSIDEIIIVMSEAYLQKGRELNPNEIIVQGGNSRKESALNGLNSCNKKCDYVLIHDAARPFVTNRIIDDCINALYEFQAVTPVMPLHNTPVKLKGVEIIEMPERTSLFEEQTPQGFHYQTILNAHQNFEGETTDDIKLVFSNGINCCAIKGHENNFKITTKLELKLADVLAKELN